MQNSLDLLDDQKAESIFPVMLKVECTMLSGFAHSEAKTGNSRGWGTIYGLWFLKFLAFHSFFICYYYKKVWKVRKL